MHIAFWSPAWPLEKYQNGIITYVHWMKRELEDQGHRVSIFTEVLDAASTEPRIYKVRRGLRDRLRHRLIRHLMGRWVPPESDVFAFSAVIAREILCVHRRDPIDVLEMEESFGWFADIGRRTSLPLLVKLHGPAFLSMVEDEINTPFGQEKVEREGRALRLAGAVISPSSSTLERTVERYSLSPKERAHVVNPLVMDDDTPLWRLEACERNTILFVGRFDLRKGADIMLKAFRSALKIRPDLRLIFVGPDHGLPAADGKRLQFAAYCDSLFGVEMRDRVDFRGRMPNREIAKLRTRAMVTVVASRWENQSYAVLETMFQGCPLVSTDAGGCPESVVNGVTGRLAKSEDSEDFAAQILAMVEDPQGARAMGQAARRYVLEQHSPKQVADASLDLYNKVISNSRPAG
jgi:glycosyltransferase involved in cell wall biosynthesis